MVLGEKHLDHLAREFAEHYHMERPHQGKQNVPLSGAVPSQSGGIVVRERLGGCSGITSGRRSVSVQPTEVLFVQGGYPCRQT